MTSDAGVPGAPRFDVVLRGYDRRQVDEHVDRLQRVLARMRADLDVARSQPMPSVPAGAPRPRPTPRPRPGGPGGPGDDQIGNFTDRMQSILQAAEEEAAEIRRNAQRAARAETEGVRAQLADLIRQRDNVLAELTRMRGQLEGMLAAPTAAMPSRPPGARPQPWTPGVPPGPVPAGPVPPGAGPSGALPPHAAPPGPLPPGPVPTGAAPSGGLP
ncbi:MAG: DivIVA domain-containing protein, partial [Pseudonocardiales bacterium]|nr:DivIVA domain-containing protein [Pseudonocardiales bacterium]